jgi:hypothetical protein
MSPSITFFFPSILYFSPWFEDRKGERKETERESRPTTGHAENDEEEDKKWV